jgi:hypothetical protein
MGELRKSLRPAKMEFAGGGFSGFRVEKVLDGSMIDRRFLFGVAGASRFVVGAEVVAAQQARFVGAVGELPDLGLPGGAGFQCGIGHCGAVAPIVVMPQRLHHCARVCQTAFVL